MLFVIKMAIIGLIIGGILGIIEEIIDTIIDTTVKNKETAKTLNKYVTVIGWLVYIYIFIF